MRGKTFFSGFYMIVGTLALIFTVITLENIKTVTAYPQMKNQNLQSNKDYALFPGFYPYFMKFFFYFRLSESPDKLGPVFNAEYNVSPAKHGANEEANNSYASGRSMRSYPTSPVSEQLASSPERSSSPTSEYARSVKCVIIT